MAQIGVLSPFAIPAPVATPPDPAAQLLVGQELQLDASTSTSLDLDAPCKLSKQLLFKWRFVSLPLSSNARFNDDQIVNPSFRLDEIGEYLVELVVTDSAGLESVPVRARFVAFDPRVTVPGGSGPYNSLVLDPGTSNTPKIAYYNANQKRAQIAVCTANCDTAPVWATHTIDDGSGLTPSSNDVGAFMSLGVSSTGNLFAGYYDTQNCRSVVAFSTDHGVTWKSYPVDPNTACGNTARNGQWLSLAVSPLTGNPSIAYQYNNNGTRTLKYAVCTANCTSTGTPPTWAFSTADSTNTNTGYYTSLAFDPTGTTENKPAIAYRIDGGGAPVGYATCSAACDTASPTWTLVKVDTNLDTIQIGGQNGTGVSLAFATTGAPSVAYRDEANKALKYAQCAAGSCNMASGWTATTVDGMGDAGEYPSLALSPAAATLNRPRISYRDANNNSLRLASYNGSAWQLMTLDDNGNPRMSSLKLTAKDGVRDSYDNNNFNGLRYIFFGP